MDFEYYKKKIINMKLDEAIQYFDELKIKISLQKDEYLNLKDIFSNELSVYNKETKVQINLITDELKQKYKDYRSAMLKDSTKKELPSTVINICNRELNSLTLLESHFPEIDENINKRLKERDIRNNANILIEKIHSKKNEYIESFLTRQEGIRAWDCLIGCIESGHITSDNIETYGITV